jgi:hypothetical protein
MSMAQEFTVDAGRRMYREGLLPDGEPMTAIVAGDVPVLGTQFSCESCHGRSGMGAAEGAYIVPPVSAQFLYVESPQPKRPAYNLASLATVLRDGVTSAGRTLPMELMPRYPLDDDAVAALAAYLGTLSAANSPGVDDEVIRFGTVMTENVDPAAREAVLAVLNQFFAEKNRQTRAEGERWDRGYTPESKLKTVFREWVLEEWTLTGPSEGWGAQLDAYYAETPVFAMVSGLGTGSWGPVSRFCEREEIPCLFPGTDLPEATAGDFYTLYFSRGLLLEAELIARDLAAQPAAKLIQVYCDPASAAAAKHLRDASGVGGDTDDDLLASCDAPLPVAELAERYAAEPDAAVVLWLQPDELAGVTALPAGRLYVSSTLLGGDLPDAIASAPGPVFMAHPFVLPGKIDPAMRRFELWARTRDVALTAPRLQAEAFFACIALSDAVKHVGRFFVRDFVLDMLDHAQSLAAYVPAHPRPTLGPRQRFLSKGGYMLPIVDGKPDTTNAAWILP